MAELGENPRSHDRFPALYVRDFRIFWTGQLISFSGTWMQSTAQGWLVYTLTNSPFYLGLVASVASLPMLLFTLIGGVIADRLMKRKLLFITQSLSVVPALALAVLTDLDLINVWLIMLSAAFLGTINAFDVPARQSFLVEMVQKGRLLNAIALNSAAFNGARIIGPFIAGLTIASVGVAACFYVNAVSFLAAIVALRMIRTRDSVAEGGAAAFSGKEGGSGISDLFRELIEGLCFIKRDKSIFRIMLLVALFSLLGIPYITLLPVFAEDILGVGPSGLGILAGSSGAGALSAALFIAFKGDIKRKGRLLFTSGIIFGISLSVFSFSNDYVVSIVTLVFAGWGMVSFLAVANSFIQLTVPDVLRGRAMSVYAFVFLGLAPIGNVVMGSVAHVTGTEMAISAGAFLCFLAVILSSRQLQTMDSAPQKGGYDLKNIS